MCRRAISIVVDDSGMALVATLMAMTLMAALATMLATLTITETRIAALDQAGSEALYAADAAVELAIDGLARAPDWNLVLSGQALSQFVDGAPAGVRTLPDGSSFDFAAETNVLRCGRPQACSPAEVSIVTAERPWGANNPFWQPYLFGRLAALLPSAPDAYVVAWVADDPAEDDGDPLRDGDLAGNAGRGIIRLIGHAYERTGVRRVLEATIQRVQTAAGPRIRKLAWREI